MVCFRTCIRAVLVCLALLGALLASTLTASSRGDTQSQIAGTQSARDSLKSHIADETARIQQTTDGLNAAQQRLDSVQQQLSARETQLADVQRRLLAARNHLVDLENRLRESAAALGANLRAAYEGDRPDLVSVVLESHGFNDLLERMSFMKRMARQDANVLGVTRTAQAEVKRQANMLASLEKRDQALTQQVLSQRNQVAALRGALLTQQIHQVGARNGDQSKLGDLNSKLHKLEAKAAAEAARANATGNPNVGGIAVNTAGMVQPPAGAPPAVAQAIAAGNAIATLPYIYGGGHASFHADGYDCSGSVSYALAAAGLVSSPMVSGDFENWGEPGPGRWITVYANADHVWMTVAGWRFDTVALAEGGTRWAQGGGEFDSFVVRHPPGL
jgi:peptidoglycan hydrolase CwlO-like protein